jgi:hypothetical protein
VDKPLADWLAVREPADFRARSAPLTRAVADRLVGDRPVRVLDLGTGTASNVRYLSDLLPAQQQWLLVDRDPEVVEQIPSRMYEWADAQGYRFSMDSGTLSVAGSRLDCRIETRCANLGELDDGLFSGRDLVTASALLDLVSEGWLASLASRCRTSGAVILFALSYNGRSRCTPSEPEDDEVRELLNRHQRANDKGFGRAAGPEAVGYAARCFADVGYHIEREASDWTLWPDMRELQRQLIEGWADAALELTPERAATIQRWLTRRLAHLDAGRSRIVVGHEDLAGWVPS